MKPHYYKLDEFGNALPCDWFEAWKILADTRGRCVACERTAEGFSVSTAFLVWDHAPFSAGPAVLFNTQVYYPDGSYRIAAQYSTIEEALRGHREVYALVSLVKDN